MTPKEKAIKLVGKYNFVWFHADVTTFKPQTFDEHIYYSYSKKCALIAINEILNILDYPSEQFNYYLKVKQEIEAL